MPTRSESAWLDAARSEILHGQLQAAQATLHAALGEFPDSVDLHRAAAGVFQQIGEPDRAAATLRDLLARDPGDRASAFALVRTLKPQGRTAAAAAVLRACMAQAANRDDANLAIAAIELLNDCDRRRDAFAIADAALTGNPDDPRLHAYAGMLAIQLGEFERARRHYLFALDHAPSALEWHVPIGLASTLRYTDTGHPDCARFRAGLQRNDLSPLARAELHFALGKACDDAGELAAAAGHFRDGNAIRHRHTPWRAKAWRRVLAVRMAAQRGAIAADPLPAFTPIFIVGMPRTGTTLLAELLARFAGVINRGELATLPQLADQLAAHGTPTPAIVNAAAAQYIRLARQDDAGAAQWCIDKQPLNFRYLDVALALFPNARIIHCQRAARDTALSLWMQCFLEDVQGYAYDFDDMALVMRGEQRLMAHWHDLYPDAIRDVHYETLVAAPEATLDALGAWLGLRPAPPAIDTPVAAPDSTISTASLWQARQPIHTRSVGRSAAYLAYVPELARWPK
ncbi:MAG TPA: sulfotransferase [Rhodanobacteraceae bacterium]